MVCTYALALQVAFEYGGLPWAKQGGVGSRVALRAANVRLQYKKSSARIVAWDISSMVRSNVYAWAHGFYAGPT
jgi:hypothetical protein